MENSVTGKKKSPFKKKKVDYCFCREKIWFHYSHCQHQLELDLLDTAPRLKEKKKKNTVNCPSPTDSPELQEISANG